MQKEGHEAWTNLAQTFILFGLKEEAAKTLNVAAGVNSELWHVWRDLMVVSSECHNYESVIKSYNKILSLNCKYVDEKILNSLTKQIVNNIKECNVLTDSDIREQLLGLFHNIVQHNEDSPDVWILYAMTTACVKQPDVDTRNKTAERLLKAQTAIVSDEKWFRNLQVAIHVLCNLHKLIDTYMSCCAFFGTSRETRKMLLTAKVFATKIIDAVKENYTDIISIRVIPTLEHSVALLENKVQKIILESQKYD